MAGRAGRGIAAGLALLLGREVTRRRRAKAGTAAEPATAEPPPPEPPAPEADRLRRELREELAKRADRG